MGTPDVVVVDHYDSYTWNVVHLIAQVTGRLPTVVEHDQVNADQVLSYSHVVLSPGPGRPDDPGDFSVGRDVLLAGTRPVLGVCLGMQGIVTTYGGTVRRVPPAHGEVATIVHTGAGVFHDLPQGFHAVRYHSLAATDLPDELEVTAWVGGGGFETRPAAAPQPPWGTVAAPQPPWGTVAAPQPPWGTGAAPQPPSGLGAGFETRPAAAPQPPWGPSAAPQPPWAPSAAPQPADPGGVVMGVRHRTLPLEGVQFHPESILSEHGARLIATFLETAA